MCVTELPRFLKLMDKVVKFILIIIRRTKILSIPRLTIALLLPRPRTFCHISKQLSVKKNDFLTIFKCVAITGHLAWNLRCSVILTHYELAMRQETLNS